MGLTLDINLKFHASVAKGLKLKVRRFWWLICKFVEVTGEKLVEGLFIAPVSSKEFICNYDYSSNYGVWIHSEMRT